MEEGKRDDGRSEIDDPTGIAIQTKANSQTRRTLYSTTVVKDPVCGMEIENSLPLN